MNARFPFLGDLRGGFGNRSAEPPLPPEDAAAEVSAAPAGAAQELTKAAQPAVDQAPVMPPGTSINDVPTMNGIPGQQEAGNDETEGIQAQDLAMRVGLPYVPTQSGGGPTVMPGFENYLPVGGKAAWEDINQRGAELGRQIDAGAQAEEDKSNALADFFKRERARQDEVQAAVKQRQLEDQAQIAAQQKQIQDATEKYSNDLADRGQYWRNPGNILAAIGAALIASVSDDKSVGIKIIQQSMNADFAQRKALADMHLGELRSNLGAYRQIAGDRALGDRLAQAEQNRIMAMEVDRIGQQFQGPIAKAKAAAIKQEFLRNYQVQMAQLHAAMIYNAPKAAPAPIANAYGQMAQSNPGDMKAYAPAKGWQAQVAAPASGKYVAAGPAPGQGVSTFRSEVNKQASQGGYMTQQQRDLLNKRYPGSADAIDTERATAVRDMAANVGVDPSGLDPRMSDSQIAAYIESKKPGASTKFNSEMEKYKRFLAEDNANISKQVQPMVERINGYRRLGRTMRTVEAVAQRLTGGDVDKLISTKTNQLAGPALVKQINEYLDSGQPGSSHEAQAREVADFISNYRQDAAMAINRFIKTQAGGNVTEGEENRLNQFIKSSHNWNSLSNFQKLVSQDAHAEAKSAIAGAKSALTSTAWNLRIGQETPETPYRGVAKSPEGPKQSEDNQSRMPVETQSTDPTQEFFSKNKNAFEALKNLKRMY